MDRDSGGEMYWWAARISALPPKMDEGLAGGMQEDGDINIFEEIRRS